MSLKGGVRHLTSHTQTHTDVILTSSEELNITLVQDALLDLINCKCFYSKIKVLRRNKSFGHKVINRTNSQIRADDRLSVLHKNKNWLFLSLQSCKRPLKSTSRRKLCLQSFIKEMFHGRAHAHKTKMVSDDLEQR